MRRKAFVKSAIVGCVVGVLPALPIWPSMGRPFEVAISVVSIPGVIAALIVGGGRVHDVNLAVLIAAGCAFYTAVTYAVLRFRNERK